MCSRDLFSLLPDDVLSSILSLLPTKEAASTTVLSKKWRNVFRLVDTLDFDDSVLGEDKLERDVFPESFKNFVDRTLALQCDYPIKKFSLKCDVVGTYNNCRKACVSRWISNVLQRGVLELDLRIKDRGLHFFPPHQLFASKTLVKLTIGTQLFPIRLPPYVLLPSLKTLFIDTVFFANGYLCDVLLAGCPVLEELSIHYNDFPGKPRTISSPTIKRLSVNYDPPDDIDSWRSSMSFNLPRLVYLEYSHSALSVYPQVNLESLVEAKLDLYGKNWSPHVRNLLLGIMNVEILHLSLDSVDMIYPYYGYELPVFNNLVKLSFGSKDKKCWRALPDLIKHSPNLETLIIQNLNGYTCNDVSMPPNKVKVLRILDYRETVKSLKQLKSFVGEFKCLEVVQVDGVVEEDNGRIKRFTIILLLFMLCYIFTLLI